MTIKRLGTGIVFFALLFVWTLPGRAQELEPRRWSHLPLGSNVAGAGYVYSTGDIAFDPVLKLEDVEFDLHTVALKYVRTFSGFGRSMRIDLTQGYQEGRWEGLLDGESASTDRSGLNDSIIRLSVNLLGAPPLRGQEFAAYRKATPRETIVGTALIVHLPTGRYYSDKLINLGANRFVIRPQLGAVHRSGPWSAELTGGIWFYTENDDFFNGKTLENDPLFGMQAHLVYTFRPGLWLAGGAAFGYGAESTVDGQSKDDHRENLAYGVSFGYPITRQVGVKLSYIGTRTQVDTGADTDSVLGGLSFLW